MPGVRMKGRKLCRIAKVYEGGSQSVMEGRGKTYRLSVYEQVRLVCGVKRSVYSAYAKVGTRVNCSLCSYTGHRPEC